MGTDFQFYKMKRILEMDGDGDHTAMCTQQCECT